MKSELSESMKSELGESELGRQDSDAVRDARWYPVYAAVVVFTVMVIAALWWFSRAFSS